MVSKCLKCGAEIPDNAQFCPSCGATKTQPTQQPPQPQQQPMQQSQPAMRPTAGQGSLEDMAKTLFSKKLIIIAVCIGVLLLIISTAMIQFTEPAQWEDMHMQHIGSLLRSMVYYGIGLMLICGGIVNKHMDKYFRLGLIIAGAIILG